jgi:hypothetical protein
VPGVRQARKPEAASLETGLPPVDPPRCACVNCRTLDALPDRLQGWPGAYQIPLFHARVVARRSKPAMLPPKSLDDWNYPGIRDTCAERCAEFGDPPCHKLADRAEGLVNPDEPLKPCGECWRDVGVEPGDEFDENAAIGRLV